ncbi:MAG: RNA polymerase sigma factor [Acidimicrobiales bacterium]
MGQSETEDISQEVAVRALRSGVSFTDADDLVPWACTVAWRVHLGDVRKRRARLPEAELRIDPPSAQNVEDEAAGRIRMSAVSHALATLKPRDRRLLLDVLVDHEQLPSSEASRQAVLRHRARARLLRAVGGASSALAWLLRRLRWSATVTAVAVGLAAALLTVAAPNAPRSGASRMEPGPRSPSTSLLLVVPASPAPSRPATDRAAPAPRRPGPDPTRTFLVKVDSGGPPVGVARRRSRPSDHLLCTGSLVLLPNVCVR